MQKISDRLNQFLLIQKKRGQLMAVIRFNPWKITHKKPFGAVKENEVATFTIEVIAEKIMAVYLVIHKDFQEEKVITMKKKEETQFSCEYFFNQQIGLYYYHFVVQTQENGKTLTEYYGPTKKREGKGKSSLPLKLFGTIRSLATKKRKKHQNGIVKESFIKFFLIDLPMAILIRSLTPPKKILIFMLPKKMIRYMSKMQMAKFYAGIFFGGNFKGILQKKSLT